MIGGLMLIMAIGGMLIIAWWADKGDDLPDNAPRAGILAIRVPVLKAAAKGRRPAPAGAAAPSPSPSSAAASPRPRPVAAHAPAILHEAEARMIAEEIALEGERLLTRPRRSGPQAPAGPDPEERKAMDQARRRFGRMG